MIPPDVLAMIAERLKAIAGPVKIDYFHQTETKLIVQGRRPCPSCEPTKLTLEEIAGLSDQIELRVHDFFGDTKMVEKWGAERVPGIVIHGEVNRPLRFYGMPGGTFLPAIVDIIVAASVKPPPPPPELSSLIKKLRDPVQIRVLGSLRHPHSAQAAATAFGLSLLSDKIATSVFAIEDNSDLIQQLRLTHIPLTLVDDKRGFAGLANSLGLAQFCLDMQAKPEDAPPPPIAPNSTATIQRKTPPPPAQGAGPPGPRRTPGGLILPGQ